MSEINIPIRKSRFAGLAGSASYIVIALLGLLLPFFIIPSQVVPLQFSKSILLSVAIVLAFLFFIIQLIKDGRIILPKNLFFLSLFLIPVVYAVSALVNGGGSMAFFGYASDIGTVVFVFLLCLLLFVTGESFQDREHTFYALLGLIISFIIVALYQLIRLVFGVEVLSFGIFNSNLSNLIGNWNDLGIFFGLAAILSVITLEMIKLNKRFKFIVYAILVVSLFFLTLVNFNTIWIMLGVFSLIFFIYVISFDRLSPNSQQQISEGTIGEEKPAQRRLSYFALFLLLFSFLFIVAGGTLGPKISSVFNISSLEVRPSWSSTFSVIGSTLKSHSLLGSGPNTFGKDWQMYKPGAINQTIFWNTDFNYGIGLIPSFIATTGILGALAWLFFLAMYLWIGVKSIFNSTADTFGRFFITSTFLSSLYLWVILVVYVPSVVIVTLAFLFTGLFVASLRREGMMRVKSLSLANHPRLSFVSVLLLVALLIGDITLGYFIVQRAVSFFTFEKSLVTYQSSQDASKTEQQVIKAISLGNYDLYYRALSEINLVKANNLLAQPGATPQSIQEEFQQAIGNAIDAAKQSTNVDPKNYQNWISLAQVYSSLVPQPFAIPGAYENAKAAYEEAIKVAPTNPYIPLLQARLEVNKGDLDKARDYANQAISLKPNYAEAHFLIAQIETTQGNVSKAIPSLETTLLLTPGDPGLYFQLGLLKYSVSDFNGAGEAFVKAISLAPDYANAKYFLGLSLSKLGQKDAALQQFQDILKTNPDSTEVKQIIANLEAGKDPLNTISPPEPRPEKRDKLPLEQTQ